MVFCTNCGKQLEDDCQFCTGCGTRVQTMSAQEGMAEQAADVNQAPAFEGQQIPPVQNQYQFNGNMAQAGAMPQPKKTNVKLIVGIAVGAFALFVILLTVILVLFNKKETLVLDDYVTITYDGYNGQGSAYVTFDYASFETDVNAILEKKGVSSSSLWTDTYIVENSFYYYLDNTYNLSNGDEIVLSYDLNNEAIADYKIVLEGTETTYTVDGLEELTEIDPFEGVDVTFSGVDGSIYAEVVNNSEDDFVKNYVWFYIDNSYDLSIGDSVTVTMSMTEEDAAYYGYKFSQTEKTYTCSEGDSYVTSMADIDDATVENLKTAALETINAAFEGSDESCAIGEWNYEGIYFLSNQNQDSWNDKNIAYVVYSSTITSSDGEFDPQIVYEPVYIANLIKKADGTIEYEDYNYLSGYAGYIGDSWTYVSSGYFDGVTMYEELITNRNTDYTYEMTESLQQFGN